ncbi:MAG: hypothetical protein GY711_23985 [bacterium]|nr:hypothetical protein [bacterium]
MQEVYAMRMYSVLGILTLIAATGLVSEAIGAPAPGRVRPSEQAGVDLQPFGLRRTLRGTRPLLVILMQLPDSEFPEGYDGAFYDRLLFGPGGPTVKGYYRSTSNGLFTLSRAGIVGPFRFRPGNVDRMEAVRQVARSGTFDFHRYDANRDGKVTPAELAVLVVAANPGTGGQTDGGTRNTRYVFPMCSTAEGTCRAGEIEVRARPSGVDHAASFLTIAHELGHQMYDMIDIYHSGRSRSNNQGLSLAGATMIGGNDNREMFHLDPWHKLSVGWLQPRTESLKSSGSATIGPPDVGYPSSQRPILFHDPDRGPNEFFLVEFRRRTRQSGDSRSDPGSPFRGYDSDVPRTGVVIWYVKLGSGRRPANLPVRIRPGDNGRIDSRVRPDDVVGSDGIGDFVAWGANGRLDTEKSGDDKHDQDAGILAYAPDWPARNGSQRIYSASDGWIRLSWLDGTDTGTRIRIGPMSSTPSTASVEWNTRGRAVAIRSRIREISPTAASNGGIIFADGTFPVQQDSLQATLVNFLGQHELPIATWTQNRISARVPESVTPENYLFMLQSGAGVAASNGVFYRVTEPTTAPPPTSSASTLPLNRWWDEANTENFTTILPADASFDFYRRVRLEGWVFTPNMPKPRGTIPLYHWRSLSRKDSFVTTDPAWAPGTSRERSGGYRFRGVVGYIYPPTTTARAGIRPLYGWESPSRTDRFVTTDPGWAGRVGDRRSPDYQFVRVEGYVLAGSDSR